MPSKRSVLPSRPPWKYFLSSRSNTEPGGDTHANRVAQDFSFISSGEPKISYADRPSTPRTASQHSRSRGPRMGCLKNVSASAMLLIEYRFDVELNPSP